MKQPRLQRVPKRVVANPKEPKRGKIVLKWWLDCVVVQTSKFFHTKKLEKKNPTGHHFIIEPHCTHPVCFPPWKGPCFYNMQGEEDSITNVMTTIWTSPSVFLGLFMEEVCPQFSSKKATSCFCWCSSRLFSVVTRDELVPSYVTRGQIEWELAPSSIMGGASHQCYWATRDRGPSREFHSLLF